MKPIQFLPAAVALVVSGVQAQVLYQGPSSSRSPYLVPTAPNGAVTRIAAIVTATDLVPLSGSPATSYEVAGILDGLGAYDNGNGTLTVLCNHELGNASGVIRRHGARGALVSELILDKNTLQVISASDLIQNVIDASNVVHNAANANGIAFNRFCSADLPPVNAFYNSYTGLGTQERIFMNGEEGGTTGYALATVCTGAEKGNTYILPKFNLSTNGSGLTGVGAWENVLACPQQQDMTLVIGDNDGGTGIMTNSVAVYIGTKQNTGTPVERAGLTNGSLYFINVAGNPAEITNTTTRATGITNGTRFSLVNNASTTFSRPEDGAWNPVNPREFWFVTTDRLDVVTGTGSNPTLGATGATNQIGMSRLWRLTFDNVANPMLGGVIDLIIDGGKRGQKVQMLDNMCVGANGRVYLTEDPGNSTYVGKTWCYDPATDTLVQLAKFDPARWGELAAAGGTPGAILPWNNDKELSGVIDVTNLFPHAVGETVLLLDAQDHSTNAAVATVSSAEGGQLLLMHVAMDASVTAYGVRCGVPGLSLIGAPGYPPRVGSTAVSNIGSIPNGSIFMSVGFSNTSVGPFALPLALGSFGMPNCFLYHDMAYGLALPCTSTGPGTAQFSLGIPASEVFVGMKIYEQAWAPYAPANPAGLITSNALQLTIGL